MTVFDVNLITHRKSTEVDGVIDLLREHGLAVVRTNLCQFPEHSEYSWALDNEQDAACLAGSRAAWFHNPGHYSIARSLTGHERELALQDCNAFWNGMALGCDTNWLNHPSSLLLSSHKVLQLSRARSLQLPTPQTLISNDKKEVLDFFRRYGGAVVKSLASGYSVYGDSQLKLYTRFYSVPPNELIEGLRFGPLIFQRRVEKKIELRVTVVDEQCFGLSADTTNLPVENTDIRRLDYKLERERFRGVSVPHDVATASCSIMRSLNLSYAGLDWVQDDAGQWLFLEVNAMGAFKWSEMCGAGNITSALAASLIRRSSQHG